MTIEETANLLAILKTVWTTHETSHHTVTAYQWALAEVSFEDAAAAAAVHMRTSVFFPKPAELLNLAMADQSASPPPGDAWEQVMKMIQHHGWPAVTSLVLPDGALADAIRAVGWRRLCLDDLSGGYLRRDFDVAYHNGVQRHRVEIQGGMARTDDAAPLPGGDAPHALDDGLDDGLEDDA